MKLKIIATFLTCTLLISEVCIAQTNLDNEIKQLEQGEESHSFFQAGATGAWYGAGIGGVLGLAAGAAVHFGVNTLLSAVSPMPSSNQSSLLQSMAGFARVCASGGALWGAVGGCGLHTIKAACRILRSFRHSGLRSDPQPKSILDSPETKSAAADRPTLLS
jgi:hypothetical protein